MAGDRLMTRALQVALMLAALNPFALPAAKAADLTLPRLSDVGMKILIDKDGRVNTEDLGWLGWKYDPQRQTDWRALKNWLAYRKSEAAAAMRRRLADMRADRDLSKLPVKCFDDLLCTQLDEAVEKIELINDPRRLNAAIAEVTPMYRTFNDLDQISRAYDKVRLGDDSSFAQELISREARDQYLQQAEHVLRERLSDDGKIVLVALIRVPFHETTFDNTPFLKAHVARDGWPGLSRVGKRGALFAWLIVQHADHAPEFQLQMLHLMEPLVDKGEVERWTYAYLYDRVNVNLGLPQRYGSQYHCVNGVLELEPLERPDEVDVLRKQMGMPPLTPVSRKCVG